MKFPAGTDGGTIISPHNEGAARELGSFSGVIEVRSGAGQGLILAEQGRFLAACFSSDEGIVRGDEALIPMQLERADAEDRMFRLRHYSREEFARAVRIAGEEHLLLEERTAGGIPEQPSPSPTNTTPREDGGINRTGLNLRLPDEARLLKIRNQPGVIAVSAFFEGFPVQSVGEEDFEHVAALAEDFLRAGSKIARGMEIGDVDQLILETSQNKCIIAPCGDLSVCILTNADAQLGLIRVLLQGIQKEFSVPGGRDHSSR